MTPEELIQAAKEIGGFKDGVFGLRTPHVMADQCESCPVIAVANKRGENFRIYEYVEAGKTLGLSRDDSSILATAADRKVVRFRNYPMNEEDKEKAIRLRKLMEKELL